MASETEHNAGYVQRTRYLQQATNDLLSETSDEIDLLDDTRREGLPAARTLAADQGFDQMVGWNRLGRQHE